MKMLNISSYLKMYRLKWSNAKVKRLINEKKTGRPVFFLRGKMQVTLHKVQHQAEALYIHAEDDP